jgi:hypothetical protein
LDKSQIAGQKEIDGEEEAEAKKDDKVAERKVLEQIDEEQGSQIPIEQGMPDSFYDTQNKIEAIKGADKMMEFENIQLMIDQQQPKQLRGLLDL